MREYKFKAWVKPVIENGEIIYSGYMIDVAGIDFKRRKIIYFEPLDMLPMIGRLEKMNFDEIILMQFIGRNDKNGIEIYEGDYISAYNGRIKGPVIFDKRGLAFGIPNGPNEIYKFSMNFLESKDIEVIGNIYENPELLGGKEIRE